MDGLLEGKVAVVTGGSGGNGRAPAGASAGLRVSRRGGILGAAVYLASNLSGTTFNVESLLVDGGMTNSLVSAAPQHGSADQGQ